MQLFLFSLKMCITAISFYWHNDTPSFVTWRSRLATAPDTPICVVIHGQFTGGVHPPNEFVLEIVSPFPCWPALVHHTLLIVYFFKELISYIGFLEKCHTSVFNILIVQVIIIDLLWNNSLHLLKILGIKCWECIAQNPWPFRYNIWCFFGL